MTENNCATEKAPLNLTPREQDVLRLLVEGHSDAEIGSALQLSRRAVSDHVGNMLAKTKLRSRTALAVYAVRNDLV